MSIRNLEALFRPRSVAVIGASERSASIGRLLTANLLTAGFDGEVYPVNPKYREILGKRAYRNVASLPEPPDLAVIATPAATVPDLVSALGESGTRSVCVISAGFSELGDDKALALQQAVLDAARPFTLRILGPNCLGLIVPGIGLNASFAQSSPTKGGIAFLAQSGAVITSVLDWTEPRGIGFSHLVSLGNMADVDFGDMLDYLANDAGTRAILLYIEAISHARKFVSAARAAARSKPVVVVKAGRHRESARAAASHTGALVGSDAVYDAVFRRAGMLRVFSLEALFDAVETLALAHPPAGRRLAILSNGGGAGVMATDALIDAGGLLARLGDETVAALNATLPPTWSHANPVDIVGDADGERYAAALSVLLDEPQADGILILNCPTAIASSADAAQAVVDTVPPDSKRTVLSSWIGDSTATPPRNLLRRHGIPTYQSPEDAVQAFMQMVDFRHNQALLLETPPSLPALFEPDIGEARAAIDLALADGRQWLNPTEAGRVMAAYGIPLVSSRLAPTPEAVGEAARAIGGPVAIKISSSDITHKSDAGGVALNVDPANAEQAALDMLQRVAVAEPEARIDGCIVQPMVPPGRHRELIVGAFNDAQFGPVILFGHGGVEVEVIDDKALGLPPVNLKLAREIIARTRVSRLLRGYRNVPAADIDEVAMILVRLSQLVIDAPEIQELDLNPVLAGADNVVALDARIRVVASTGNAEDRLAIRPYPTELEQDVTLQDGRTLLLRPILPEDEPALQAGFARLTPEQVRSRFFMPLKELDHVMAARFSQIDYDRQMALVLTEHGVPGQSTIYAVVRLMEDPDRESAEFAIVIDPKLTGQGLGDYLMRRIIDYARQRGVGELFGDVLWDNRVMLQLCHELDFDVAQHADEPGVARVRLSLAKQTT